MWEVNGLESKVKSQRFVSKIKSHRPGVKGHNDIKIFSECVLLKRKSEKQTRSPNWISIIVYQ